TEVPSGTQRGNDVAISRAFSLITLACALVLPSCERAPKERRLPVPDLRGGGAALEIDPAAALDPRVIPLDPAHIVGTRRICDLAFVGEAGASTGAYRLPPGIAERRTVRCYAATGEGDVDLLVPEALAGPSTPLTVKRRIRLLVRSADGGFE